VDTDELGDISRYRRLLVLVVLQRGRALVFDDHSETLTETALERSNAEVSVVDRYSRQRAADSRLTNIGL